MRPGQQNKRGRGRNINGGNRKPSNPLSRSYDSTGPDVKVRGNAQTVAEKYVTLARDAQSSGDRVMGENYLQHAEHYNRIVALGQAQMQERQQREDALREQQEKTIETAASVAIEGTSEKLEISKNTTENNATTASFESQTTDLTEHEPRPQQNRRRNGYRQRRVKINETKDDKITTSTVDEKSDTSKAIAEKRVELVEPSEAAPSLDVDSAVDGIVR